MIRVLLPLVLLLALPIAPAIAETDVGGGHNSFDVWAKSTRQKSVTSNAHVSPTGSSSADSTYRYTWRTACYGGTANSVTGAPVCPANTCSAGERQYRLWRTAPGPARPMGLVCSGNGAPAAPAAAAPPPQVTDAMVLAAFRRIPLPAPKSHSQPDDKTLVNFDTIFYTQAQPLTRTVTILGQRVRLEIRPSRFEWVYGDGTTMATSTPGSPYPDKEILHRYQDAHTTVQHHVEVTWSAQWSLNGGPLRPVSGTVTSTGPATPLRVAEASPALSGQGH